MLRAITWRLADLASSAVEQVPHLSDLASRVAQFFQRLFHWFFFGGETPPALPYREWREGEGTPGARKSFSSQPEGMANPPQRPLTPVSPRGSASSLEISSDSDEDEVPGAPAMQEKTIDPEWFKLAGAVVIQAKKALKKPLSLAQTRIASLLCSLGALEKSLKGNSSPEILGAVLREQLQLPKKTFRFSDLLREKFPQWKLDGVDKSECSGSHLSDNFFNKLQSSLSQLALDAATDKRNQVVIVARGQDDWREYCAILCEKYSSFCLFDFQTSERAPTIGQTVIRSQYFTPEMSRSILRISEILVDSSDFCTLTQYKITDPDFLAHWLIDRRFRAQPSDLQSTEVLEIVRISPIMPQLQQSFVSIEPAETGLGLTQRQYSNLFVSQTAE